jgi:methionine-rich copper-binding protein CopC
MIGGANRIGMEAFMGGRVPRPAVVLLAVVGGLLCALLPAAPAAAHNSLASSDPADGARIAKPPAQVRLTFLSRLDPGATKVTITGPDNIAATGGAPVFAGSRVTVPFKPGAAGLYIMAYQVPSDDGHLGKGEIRFTLTVGATLTGSPSPSANRSLPAITPSPSATVARPLTPTAGTGDNGGGPSWWPWALAGVLLLAAGTGAVLLVRRRRQG